MATNNFNPDPSNDAFEPLMSYFDPQGVNRLESANISSYGFDGFIPTTVQNRTASGIIPGMSISLTGSALGQYFYKVISNNIGDREFADEPSGEILIEYLDNNQIIQSISASVSDIFSVSYEDWDGKDLGTTGWYLGNSGNAIFSNVAVRGRIEATSGKVEDLVIGEAYYSILNIYGVENQSSSVTGDKGQFIMYVLPLEYSSTNSGKLLYSNDIVELSGVSASGWAYTFGSPLSASSFFNIYNKIKILSASYSEFDFSLPYPVHKYHCEIVQSGMISDWNLGSLSASSGSFTFGAMNMGDYKTYSLANQDTIEGFVFNQIGQGGTWDAHIPDYLDVSGRFRLGGGKLIFDGETLSIDANLAVGDVSASYVPYSYLSASYADLSQLATSGTTIINGGNITTGTISAARLDSSVIVSSELSTAGSTIINGANITTGNINANLITTGSITSAVISGNTIKGGTITGQTISGGSITGATIKTNTTGQRIEFSTSQMTVYDSSNINCGGIYGTGGELLLGGGTNARLYSTNIYFYNGVLGPITTISGGTLNVPNGITNTGGQLTSLPTYNNAISGASRRTMSIGSAGSIGYDASSFELKHNIRPLGDSLIKIDIPEDRLLESDDLNINPLDVLNLTPVMFEWDEDNTIEIGFIAEEVKEIIPQAFIDGEYPSIHRDTIWTMLFYVVQQQQKSIEDLQNRVLQLESQLGG